MAAKRTYAWSCSARSDVTPVQLTERQAAYAALKYDKPRKRTVPLSPCELDQLRRGHKEAIARRKPYVQRLDEAIARAKGLTP